jgi:hypothetical protein
VVLNCTPLWSSTVEVHVAAGELVVLACVMNVPKSVHAFEAIFMNVPGLLALVAGLPVTGFVLLAAGFGVETARMMRYFTSKPGALTLHLHSDDVTTIAEGANRTPRLTIGKVMALIAGLAVILGIAVNEKRIHGLPNAWPMLVRELLPGPK